MKTGWERKPLGSICTLQRGLDLPTPQRVKGIYPLVSSSGVIDTHIEGPIKGPGVITGRSGSVGKVFFVNEDFWPLNTTLYVRDFHGNEPRFVFHLLNHFNLQRFAGGAGVPTLNRNDVHGEPVFVPSDVQEQQRIVAILDEAFEAIAAARANAEQNRQNARALFESYLQSVFSQKGGNRHETTLGSVCTFIGGSQPPKAVFEKEPTTENIRLIQIRDYKSDKNTVYIPRAMAKRFCDAKDVMIGRYGPPLFQILRGLEGAYNVALIKAVPDESMLSRDYLFYFLKHSDILQYVIFHSERAAGQIGVTKETLEPYPIAIPTQLEQERIVKIVSKLEYETQRLESLYQRKIAALDELKQSLLQQAFSGQL
ncbi:restriction endonuclease subunit S [Aeromonas veronii]|uniref:restriction endonuclease subunit S n=1 Tax=Aeromonas veronii TaxID=654 RepID=UPI001115C27F|nr:restriction endonuclease subunit S [Aeromonas veronii]TNI50839.1 restriction endonuclease subunit S [Aeromonas veronii]